MPSTGKSPTPRFCIDLFAGAGGLSLGLEQAGYTSVLAVEKSDMAAQTYYENLVRGKHGNPSMPWDEFHPVAPTDVDAARRLQLQISMGLAVAGTSDVLQQMDAVRDRLRAARCDAGLEGEELDLIAGGPPCQGFSLAGLRNPNDRRNQLPYEFLEFVEQLRPRAVLIENVAGIGQAFRSKGQASPVLLELVEALKGLEYHPQVWRLNAQHFGVAQHRPRIMIAAVRGDLLDAAAVDATTWADQWKSEFAASGPPKAKTIWDQGPKKLEFAPAKECVKTAVPVRKVLSGLARTATYPPAGNGAEPDGASPSRRPANHYLRRHGPRTTARFALAQYLAERGVSDNIFHDASEEAGLARVEHELRTKGLERPVLGAKLSKLLVEAGIDPKQPLFDVVVALKTGKHSQRPLRADKPAPTMMSLPDDHIHYAAPRTLTVREMAQIQSFPATYRFYGKETTGAARRKTEVVQYTQVGNAVPPKMAKAVTRHLRRFLDDLDRRASSRKGRSSRASAASRAG